MNAPVAENERSHARTATLSLELEPTEVAPEPPKRTQEAGEYKKHSLAAHYWGDIPQSAQPLRYVAAAEAQETILRGLLDTPTDRRQRNPADWLMSVVLHILVVGMVLLIPFVFTQAIDLHNFQLTYLAMPKPPAAAPAPLPPALGQAVRRATRPVQFRPGGLIAPTLIPQRVAVIKDEPAPDINPGGVIGGVPGGESGGVLGGILGGTEHMPAPAAPAGVAPPAAKKSVYRIGGKVKPPRAITVVDPVYSPIARAAHAEGVVVIDAFIDEHGDVVEARAVSGPGLLIPAALQAVMQWKYEPTYLDGTPVAIRMEVQVHFSLR